MDTNQREIERLVAFGQYLSWSVLLRTMYYSEISREPDPDDERASDDYEWRTYGLLCYFYASLYVVVEAWSEMGFSDPTIDSLLSHPGGYRELLRRFRNGVFHFQPSITDARLQQLLSTGDEHVEWVRALEQEFVRYFNNHFETLADTESGSRQVRDTLWSILHWVPLHPRISSAERTLALAEIILTGPGFQRSAEEQGKLTEAVADLERLSREVAARFEAQRIETLNKLGIK